MFIWGLEIKKTNAFVIIGNEHKNWSDVSDFLLGVVSFLLKSYFLN